MNRWLTIGGLLPLAPLAMVLIFVYAKTAKNAMTYAFGDRDAMSMEDEDDAQDWWFFHLLLAAGAGFLLVCIGMGWW